MESNFCMRKRKCHAFTVPEVGLGTYNTFDIRANRDLEDRSNLLKLCKEHGATLIDTSSHFGESEKIIGKTLKDREGFQLCTKVWTSGKRAGLNQIIQSFAFLQSPYIDIFYIHNLLDWETHIETIEKMQDEDKIGLAGVSHFSSGAYPEMREVMETERVQVVQVPYNVIEQKAESEIFPLAEKLGLGVITIMPFNQGSLFRFKRRAAVDMEPLKAVGINTWSQALLAWVLADPRVSCVVPATSNPDHLLENVVAGDLPRIDEELRKHIEKEGSRWLV